MAAPVLTTVLDDFNRASLGANWSTDPFHEGAAALAIDSSTRLGSGGSTNASSWFNLATYGPDCELQITLETWAPAANLRGIYLAVRTQQESAAVGTGDGYRVGFLFDSGDGTNDRVYLRRIDNGAQTDLLGAPGYALVPNFATGDVIAVVMTGTLLEAWRKLAGTWSLLTSYDTVSDGTKYSDGGHFSIAGADPNSFYDNMVGGTVPSPLPIAPPQQAIPFMNNQRI